MALLEDLADYLSEEAAMTVHEAVLLMSYADETVKAKDKAPSDVPKVRLFTDGVITHGFFRAPRRAVHLHHDQRGDRPVLLRGRAGQRRSR